jgi:potassium/sodium efflux P-type ATPase
MSNRNDPKHRLSADYLNLTVKSPPQDNDTSYNAVQTPRKSQGFFPNLDVEETEDRRLRHMNEAEKEIATHPKEARQSQDQLAMTDESLWHLQPLDILIKTLESDREIGLATKEASRRLETYGANSLEADEKTPIYILFLLQYANVIVMLLVLAAVACAVLQEWVEAIAIFAIVTLNAFIATWQEKSAGDALEALAKMSSPQCSVLRDGSVISIDSDQLVPGDIVYLTTGDVVPADLRLLESNDLKVNEMLLTGESEDVSKKWNAKVQGSKKLTQDNMVFSSTTVAAGNAIGAVVETGMNTRVGSIAKLLKGSKDEEGKNAIQRFLAKHQPKMTPLQHALHKLGVFMGALAFSVCGVVFVVGMIRADKNPLYPDRPTWLNMIMTAVALAVSAVPEGLPMVVTICLSSGTAEMVRKNVLVRKLAAVETLGSASVICTDKTGTLTEGKMTALKMWSDFKEYSITGKGFIPEGDILHNGKSVVENVQVRSTLLSCVLCSNTKLIQEEQDNGEARWRPQGNSSEAPLVVAAAKAGIWEEYVADKYPRVLEVPFSSARKMMITVNETRDGHLDNLALPKGTNMIASVKGAPNYILENCTQYVDSEGNVQPLDEAGKAHVMNAVDDLSSQALRVLAVAIRPLDKLPYSEDCDDVEEKFAALSKPLILMGLMASIDPERDGVKQAIETARQASIRTVMITGDYLKTAVAIARNIDLIQVNMDASEAATDCNALRSDGVYISDDEIDAITSRTLVFARAKPEDKIEIVKSLQRQGLVSAMTGDGVNDAPALKESDIGVAMGITGTEVAKGASDMVLMDDNFCSIVSAVEKGRVIYANIQKFVCFLLSTNIGEIIILFSAIAAGLPAPLGPLQILILNLCTDGMPAVALSLEKGDATIMDDKPRPKGQPIIHGRLWTLVLLNAVFIASGTLIAFLLGTYWNFGALLQDDIISEDQDLFDYKNLVCNRWFGITDGFQLTGDCSAVGSDGMPIFAPDDQFCRVDYNCVEEGFGRIQAMSFVALALTEVFRAYTIRSFTEHVFKGVFSNKYMQGAAIASIILTGLITNVPGVMDIFKFSYIPWYCWMVSIACALFASSLGEVVKCFIRSDEKKQRKEAVITGGFEDVLHEVRALRNHIEHLENQFDEFNKADSNAKIV